MVEIFNSLGLEVDAFYESKPPFSGVVVGRIERLSKHPERADLFICDVLVDRLSEELVQVVCGDQTLQEQERVVLARVGATLPDGRVIKKTSIHGVESNGMLCSGKELAISHEEDVVWRMAHNSGRIGACPSKTMWWSDHVLEFDLTPNRGDCFSVLGLARELSVALNIEHLNYLTGDLGEFTPRHNERIAIDVQAPEACPIYHGVVIKNVSQDDEFVHYTRSTLIACGVRPVNVVVDCLNYELLKTGQPTHAFDLEKVKEGIVVRYARSGEKILLLDGTNVKLDPSVLIIASGDRPVAIAGVMGSLDSAVTEDTKDILLEVAYFTPEAVRGTARMYGLQTEASLRYERGIDFSIQLPALRHACDRLVTCVRHGPEMNIGLTTPGEVVSVVSEQYLPRRATIFLPKELPRQRIGHFIDPHRITQMFNQLDFETRHKNEGWQITPPPHRYDIEIPEDLVEEICRIYGYDKIPSEPLQAIVKLRKPKRTRGDARGLRAGLSSLGYNEAITYSFIPKETNDMFSNSNKVPELANPISIDRSVMRCSVIPGLLTTAAYNIARQVPSLRLFEYGQCFEYDAQGHLHQRDHVGGVLIGRRDPENWANRPTLVDFYDVKADLETLLCYTEVDFASVESKWLDPGTCAVIKVRQEVVGVIGKVRPTIARQFQIDEDVYSFELDALKLRMSTHPRLVEFSTYPSVRRDLALVVDKAVTIRQIETVVRESTKDLLVDFAIFDVFGGPQFEKNQHSIGIGITLRHQSRTLQDDEVNALMNTVVGQLSDQFHAKLRT